MKRFLLVAMLVLFAVLPLIASAAAEAASTEEEWVPTDEIRMIVPYKSGGGSDMMARIWTSVGAKYFKTAFAIDNMPGGSQAIGWTELINSKADGYTIGVANASVCTNPLTSETPFVYTDELDPLVKVADQPYVVYVRSDSGIESLKDLEAALKAREVLQASNRVGGATHWELEYFAYKAGSDITSVIYSGGAEAIAALLGKHVDVTVQSPADGKEYLRSGELKAIAVLSKNRITNNDVFKDIPTSVEQGYDWLLNSSFAGYAIPKGTPANIVKYFEDCFREGMKDPEVIAAIEGYGYTPAFEDSATLRETWDQTINTYKTVLGEIYERLYDK